MTSLQKNITAIAVAVLLVGAAVFFVTKKESQETAPPVNNVTIADGKQVIDLTAKGGYQPRKTIAKAGLPTVIRFNTKGTFDCSAAVVIPSLDISKTLSQSGTEEVGIGVSKAGTLQGSCSMGMYPFEIEFQ